MKKIILCILTILIGRLTVDGQITIPITYASLTTAPIANLPNRVLTDAERDLYATPGQTVNFNVTGVPAGKSIKINDRPMITGTPLDLSADLRNALSTSPSPVKTFKVKIVTTSTASEVIAGTMDFTWTKKPKDLTVDIKKLAKSLSNRKREIDKFRKNYFFSNPYDNKQNSVHLFFDEDGKLLNALPVNVDQNDLFYMHIVCVKGDEEKYRINITEGEYAPSDLSIRPFDKLSTAITGQDAGEKQEDLAEVDYTSITLKAGPFTSDYFKFQIAYDSSGTEKNSIEYKLKINKLYHVGVGVSLITSNLYAPTYKPYFNGTDTTIEAFNGGSRTLFTFNVIWYWTIFHQKKEGSVIPNGRDVLKDEPSFSMTRLFPTVGVTIDDKFKENFFLGVVYEFARGGSLTCGAHYGRVSRLKDKNFELGKTKFSGQESDIVLDQVYRTGFYFGLNVDTRILNLLFSKGQ